MKNFLTYSLSSFCVTTVLLFLALTFLGRAEELTNAEYAVLACINKKVESYENEVWEVTGKFESVSFKRRQIFEEECRQ